jgi:hypothetical protein
LLATAADYELARKLALGPLHNAIGLGPDFRKCIEFAAKLPDRVFSSNDAGTAWGDKSRKVTHDWLKKLAEVGVVKCVAQSVGNTPARWQRTGKSVDELLLPSVATVRKGCVTALPVGKNG